MSDAGYDFLPSSCPDGTMGFDSESNLLVTGYWLLVIGYLLYSLPTANRLFHPTLLHDRILKTRLAFKNRIDLIDERMQVADFVIGKT